MSKVMVSHICCGILISKINEFIGGDKSCRPGQVLEELTGKPYLLHKIEAHGVGCYVHYSQGLYRQPIYNYAASNH